ncbi:PREDICTED: uncharacterized protein LOC109481158 [Branchiostoma belcheri]|uniref:Uncharacterized protein LOC109481158 n=1 Tax=Branchiostoma belcheri TaxID=7741 RepID=A0A6P4ZD21_BRABE|nr:PREDICTED: uncharacterized protein LOC109481158 [Branchiostoma belcheri]
MAALLYCFLVVVFVGAQAFQPNRGDSQLQQMMKTFADEMKKTFADEMKKTFADELETLKQEIEDMKKTAEPALGGSTGSEQKSKRQISGENGGSVYIRWGRTSCPNDIDTSLVYDGIAGGTQHTHSGGGANYVCLPKDPEWGVFTDGNQGTAYMCGAEYQVVYGNNPFQGASLHDHDVPCAVCHVASRGSKLMIPARLICPSGWTREYRGYLMTERYSHSRSEFVCMDEEPEARPGGHADHNGALFYPIEANCGALPCPNYVQGRELTCVVCTK